MKNFKIEIEDFHVVDGGCFLGNKRWDNGTLFNAAKGIEPYDLQLSAIDLESSPWNCDTFYNFLFHAKRIENSDMSFPIIQMPTGYIVDGWHRIAKAILRGDETIKCVRLKTMPEPDSIDDGSKG